MYLFVLPSITICRRHRLAVGGGQLCMRRCKVIFDSEGPFLRVAACFMKEGQHARNCCLLAFVFLNFVK